MSAHMSLNRRSILRALAYGMSFGALSAGSANGQAYSLDIEIDASAFGVLPSNPNNLEAFQKFINYLAQTGYAGRVSDGLYKITGSLSTPPQGRLTLRGAGLGRTFFVGTEGVFLKTNGPLRLNDIAVSGFEKQIICAGIGNIQIANCRFDGSGVHRSGFLSGAIDANIVSITNCTIANFSSFGVFVNNAKISERATFSRNQVRNVTRYVYRISHDAPLFFEHNDINGVTSGDFSGKAAVARVVMPGGSTSYIRNNTIKNVTSKSARCVLLYWSGGNAVITGNVFGKFSSADRAYLVQEKSRKDKYLILSDNQFLAGNDLADFDAVLYCVAGIKQNPSYKSIERNRGKHLQGKLVSIFQPKNSASSPGNFIIRGNAFDKVDAPALVSITQGASNITISENIIGNMSNPKRQPITGSAVIKSLVGVSISAKFGAVDGVQTQNNVISFSHDGEAKPISSSLFYVRIISEGAAQTGAWTSTSDTVSNSDNILKLSNIPSGNFNVQSPKISNLSGVAVAGVPTSSARF